jgi:hypothetical protein
MIDHDGYHLINLDKAYGGGTQWIGLIIEDMNAYYCDSYGICPPEIDVRSSIQTLYFTIQ